MPCRHRAQVVDATLIGNTIGLADIALVAHTRLYKDAKVSTSDYPNTARWIKDYASPSIKLAQVRKFVFVVHGHVMAKGFEFREADFNGSSEIRPESIRER